MTDVPLNQLIKTIQRYENKKEIKSIAKETPENKPEAVIYIGKLYKYGCGYHMDDDATELECFGKKLGRLANKRADECFELLTNNEYCPHAVGLACFMD